MISFNLGRSLFHDFRDVRQMHFDRMLVFVNAHVHPGELFRLLELGVDLLVDFQIVQRCFVFVSGGQSAATYRHMMRWPQDENAFSASDWEE